MMCCGAYQSVMLRHNAESFPKRCLPVLGSHPFFQIVDDGQVGIVQGTCLFHHPDAPVEISGEPVLSHKVLQAYALAKKA